MNNEKDTFNDRNVLSKSVGVLYITFISGIEMDLFWQKWNYEVIIVITLLGLNFPKQKETTFCLYWGYDAFTMIHQT